MRTPAPARRAAIFVRVSIAMPLSKTRSELIFDHAVRFILPFRSAGHAWAVIPDGPFQQHAEPIHSRDFREWLANSFYQEHGLFPGAAALDNAIRMLESRARRGDSPGEDIFARLGFRGDRRRPDAILIHLGNAAHDVVEITSAARRTVSDDSWQFLTSAATRPLPRPVHSTVSPLQHLRDILRLPDPVLHRALIWLFAALRPAGPYPVLVITGPQSSGKSTLARTLRDLIDPVSGLVSLPNTPHELFAHAIRHHALAFDHVSAIRSEVAAAVGRLASGTAMPVFSRNAFDDPRPVPLARPMVLIAPAVHRHFATHAIHIHLETIAAENVRNEARIERDAETAAPAFLGAMCDSVTKALACDVEAGAAGPPSVSRLADVHAWTASAAAQLGLTAEDVSRALADSPLVRVLQQLLAEQPSWTGTATELAAALRKLDFAVSGPRALSQTLNTTPLALFGIQLKRRHLDDRLLELTQASRICVGDPPPSDINEAFSGT
jgi:energy-coupling factor transporter ATP-binding protein EcfA2